MRSEDRTLEERHSSDPTFTTRGTGPSSSSSPSDLASSLVHPWSTGSSESGRDHTKHWNPFRKGSVRKTP